MPEVTVDVTPKIDLSSLDELFERIGQSRVALVDLKNEIASSMSDMSRPGLLFADQIDKTITTADQLLTMATSARKAYENGDYDEQQKSDAENRIKNAYEDLVAMKNLNFSDTAFGAKFASGMLSGLSEGVKKELDRITPLLTSELRTAFSSVWSKNFVQDGMTSKGLSTLVEAAMSRKEITDLLKQTGATNQEQDTILRAYIPNINTVQRTSEYQASRFKWGYYKPGSRWYNRDKVEDILPKMFSGAYDNGGFQFNQYDTNSKEGKEVLSSQGMTQLFRLISSNSIAARQAESTGVAIRDEDSNLVINPGITRNQLGSFAEGLYKEYKNRTSGLYEKINNYYDGTKETQDLIIKRSQAGTPSRALLAMRDLSDIFYGNNFTDQNGDIGARRIIQEPKHLKEEYVVEKIDPFTHPDKPFSRNIAIQESQITDLLGLKGHDYEDTPLIKIVSMQNYDPENAEHSKIFTNMKQNGLNINGMHYDFHTLHGTGANATARFIESNTANAVREKYAPLAKMLGLAGDDIFNTFVPKDHEFEDSASVGKHVEQLNKMWTDAYSLAQNLEGKKFGFADFKKLGIKESDGLGYVGAGIIPGAMQTRGGLSIKGSLVPVKQRTMGEFAKDAGILNENGQFIVTGLKGDYDASDLNGLIDISMVKNLLAYQNAETSEQANEMLTGVVRAFPFRAVSEYQFDKMAEGIGSQAMSFTQMSPQLMAHQARALATRLLELETNEGLRRYVFNNTDEDTLSRDVNDPVHGDEVISFDPLVHERKERYREALINRAASGELLNFQDLFELQSQRLLRNPLTTYLRSDNGSKVSVSEAKEILENAHKRSFTDDEVRSLISLEGGAADFVHENAEKILVQRSPNGFDQLVVRKNYAKVLRPLFDALKMDTTGVQLNTEDMDLLADADMDADMVKVGVDKANDEGISFVSEVESQIERERKAYKDAKARYTSLEKVEGPNTIDNVLNWLRIAKLSKIAPVQMGAGSSAGSRISQLGSLLSNPAYSYYAQTAKKSNDYYSVATVMAKSPREIERDNDIITALALGQEFQKIPAHINDMYNVVEHIENNGDGKRKWYTTGDNETIVDPSMVYRAKSGRLINTEFLRGSDGSRIDKTNTPSAYSSSVVAGQLLGTIMRRNGNGDVGVMNDLLEVLNVSGENQEGTLGYNGAGPETQKLMQNHRALLAQFAGFQRGSISNEELDVLAMQYAAAQEEIEKDAKQKLGRNGRVEGTELSYDKYVADRARTFGLPQIALMLGSYKGKNQLINFGMTQRNLENIYGEDFAKAFKDNGGATLPVMQMPANVSPEYIRKYAKYYVAQEAGGAAHYAEYRHTVEPKLDEYADLKQEQETTKKKTTSKPKKTSKTKKDEVEQEEPEQTQPAPKPKKSTKKKKSEPVQEEPEQTQPVKNNIADKKKPIQEDYRGQIQEQNPAAKYNLSQPLHNPTLPEKRADMVIGDTIPTENQTTDFAKEKQNNKNNDVRTFLDMSAARKEYDYEIKAIEDLNKKFRTVINNDRNPDQKFNKWEYYGKQLDDIYDVKYDELQTKFKQGLLSQEDLDELDFNRNVAKGNYNDALRVAAVSDLKQGAEDIEKAIGNMSKSSSQIALEKTFDNIKTRVEEASAAYETLKKSKEEVEGINNDGKDITEADRSALEKAKQEFEKLKNAEDRYRQLLQSNQSLQDRADETRRIKESDQLDALYGISSLRDRYQSNINQQVREAAIRRDSYIQREVNSGRMTESEAQVYKDEHSDEQLEKVIKRNSSMEGFSAAIEPFTSRIQRSLTSFISSSFSKIFQNAKQFIQQFDSEMNEIQMISLKTNEEMEPIRAQTIDKAIGLRTSVANVAGVEAALYRQGLSDSEVASRTDDIIKFSTVTGTKVESATKIITTALQNDLVSSAQEAMDALTALGDSAATTAEEIAKGMQKSAAAAKVAGVSYSELTSMLTVITSKTQLSGQMAGTALQTIFNRMHKVTTSSLTKDVNGETTSLNDVESALSLAGVSLRADNETFRNTTDVLRDLAKVWQDLNDVQKSNVITAMAGTRQSNMFSTLMEGMAEDGGAEFDRLLGLASDSEGITQSKYEVAVTSLNAAVETLKSTFDGLVESFTTNGLAQAGVDFVTNIVSGFTAMSEQGNGAIVVLQTILSLLSGIVAQAVAFNALKTVGSVAAIPGLGPILALLAGIGVGGGLLAASGALDGLFGGGKEFSEVEVNKQAMQTYTDAQKKRTDKIETLRQKVSDVYDQYKEGKLDVNSESVKEAENNIQQLIALLPDLKGEITNAGDAFKNWADLSGTVDKSIENAKNNAAEVAALFGVKSSKERYTNYIAELDKNAGSLTGESIRRGTEIGGYRGFLDNVISNPEFAAQMSRMYVTGEVPDVLKLPVTKEANEKGRLSEMLAAYLRMENNPVTGQPFTAEEIASFENQLSELNEEYGGIDFRKLYEWFTMNNNIPASEAAQAKRYAMQLYRDFYSPAGQVTEGGSLYPYQIFVDAMTSLHGKQPIEGEEYLKSLVDTYFEYDSNASNKYAEFGVNDFASLVSYDPAKSKVNKNASELYAMLYQDIENSLSELAQYVDLIGSGKNTAAEDYVRDILSNDSYLGSLVKQYSGGNDSVINGLVKQFVNDHQDVDPYDFTPELIHRWLVGDYTKNDVTGEINYSGKYTYTDKAGNTQKGKSFYNANDTLEAAAENARKNAYIQRAGVGASDSSAFKYSWRNSAGEAILGFDSYETEDIQQAINDQRNVLVQVFDEQIAELTESEEDLKKRSEYEAEKKRQLAELDKIEQQLATYDKTAVGNNVYKNGENGVGYEVNQTTEQMIDSLSRQMSDKDKGFKTQYRLMGNYLRQTNDIASLNQLVNGTNFPSYQSFFQNDKTLLEMMNSINRGEDIYSLDSIRDYVETKLYGGSMQSIVANAAKSGYSYSQGRYNLSRANAGDQIAQQAVAAALGLGYQTYLSNPNAWNENYSRSLEQAQRTSQEQIMQMAADFLGANDFDSMIETTELPEVEDAARTRIDEMYAEIEKEEADLLKAEQSLQEARPTTIISPFAQVTGIQPKQSITESSAERAQETIDKKREEIAKKRKEADEYTQNTQAKLIDYVTEQAQQANVEDAEIEKAIKKATDKRGVFNAQSFYEELGITPVNQADVKALNERLAGSGWTATLEKGQGFQMSYNEADYNPFLQYQNQKQQYTAQDISGLMQRAMSTGLDWDTLMQQAGTLGFSEQDIQQLMNTDVYKYLSLNETQRGQQEGRNLLRNIDITVSGVSELEEAGKVAEGTLAKIDALKKGGQIALTAQLQIKAEGFQLDQTLARLNNGTEAEKLQEIMNLTGATEQQVLTNLDYWNGEAQAVGAGRIEQRRLALEQSINNTTGEEQRRLIETAQAEGYNISQKGFGMHVGTTSRVGNGNVLRTSAYTNANPFFLSDDIYNAAMNMIAGGFDWQNNPELEAAVQSSGYTNLNNLMTMRAKNKTVPEWMTNAAYSELYSARLQELSDRGLVNSNVPGIMQGLLSNSAENREAAINELLSGRYTISQAENDMQALSALTAENWDRDSGTYLNKLASTFGWSDRERTRYSQIGNRDELQAYVAERAARSNASLEQLFGLAGVNINPGSTAESLTRRLGRIAARPENQGNPIYSALTQLLATNGVSIENGQLRINEEAGNAATAAAIRLSAINNAAGKVYQTADLSRLNAMSTQMSIAQPGRNDLDKWLVNNGIFSTTEEFESFVGRNAEVGTKIGEYMAGTAEFSDVLESIKNAQISIEVSGLSELEQAGKIAEGTSQAIENLKKGGSFAIKAQIDLETSAFGQSQNIAKWLSGDSSYMQEAAISAGFSELQWQNDREGVTALMNSYIDNMRQTAVATVQAYIDQGEMSTARNLADMLGVDIAGPDASQASYEEWEKSGTTMAYADWLQRRRTATLGEAPSQVYEEDPILQQVEQLRKQWSSTSAETRNNAMRGVTSAVRSLAENQYYREQANAGNWSNNVVQAVAGQLGLNVRDVNRAVASGQTGNILTMLNAQEAADVEAMNTQLSGMGEKLKAQLQLGKNSSVQIDKTNVNDFADRLDEETRAAIQEAVDAGIDVSITTNADGVVTVNMSGIETTYEGYEYNPEEGFGSFGNIAQNIYRDNAMIGKSNGLAALIGGAESAGDILTAIAQGGKIGDLYELINAAGGIDALTYSEMIRDADENGTLSQLNNEGLEQYLRNTILSQSAFSGAANAYELTEEEKAAIVRSFLGSSFTGDENDYRSFLPENYQQETPEMQQALENEARQQWTQSRWLGYNYNAMASIAGQDLANAGAMAIMSGTINPFTNEQQQFIDWRTQNAMNGISGLTAAQQAQFTQTMFNWMNSGTLNTNIQANGGWQGTVAQNMIGGSAAVRDYASQVSQLESWMSSNEGQTWLKENGMENFNIGSYGDLTKLQEEYAKAAKAGNAGLDESAKKWQSLDKVMNRAGLSLNNFTKSQRNATKELKTAQSFVDEYGDSADAVMAAYNQFSGNARERFEGRRNMNAAATQAANSAWLAENWKSNKKLAAETLGFGSDVKGMEALGEQEIEAQLKAKAKIDISDFESQINGELEAACENVTIDPVKLQQDIEIDAEGNAKLNADELIKLAADMGWEEVLAAAQAAAAQGATVIYTLTQGAGGAIDIKGEVQKLGSRKPGGGGGGGKSAVDKALQEVQQGLYVSEHEARMAELNLGWQQKYGSSTSSYAALERQRKAQQDLAKSYLDAAKKLKEQLKTVKEGSEDYYKLLKAIEEYLEKAEQASQKAKEVFFQMQEIARKSAEWQQALEHHDVSMLDIQLQRQQKTGTGEEQRQTLFQKQEQEAEELDAMREKLALYEKQYRALSKEERSSEYGKELLQKILQTREEIASFGTQQEETALQIQATTRAIREQAIQLAGYKTSLADAKIQTAGQGTSLKDMNVLYEQGIEAQRVAAAAQLQYIETLKQQLAETRYGTAAYNELLGLLSQAQIGYEQARKAIEDYTKAIRDNKIALKQYRADKEANDVNNAGATRQRYDSRVSSTKRKQLIKDEVKQKQQAMAANNEVIAMYEVDMAKGRFGAKTSPEYQQALETVRQLKATNAQYATDIDLARYEEMKVDEDRYRGELEKRQFNTEGASYVLSTYEGRASSDDKRNLIAEQMKRRQDEISARNKLLQQLILEQQGYEYGSQDWYSKQSEIDELRKANAEAYDANMTDAIKARDYQYSEISNRKDEADYGYSLVSSLRKYFADEITMKDTNSIIAEEIGARNEKLSANDEMMSYLRARMASGEAAVGSDDFNKWMKELQSLEQESINLQTENKDAAKEMFRNAETDLGYDISTEQYDASMVQKFVSRYQQRASSEVVGALIQRNIKENNDLIALYDEGINLSEAYLAKFGKGTAEYQATLKKIQEYQEKKFDLETQNMDLEKKQMENQLLELQQMGQFLQHQLNLLSYQESMYQNRGELTNVNILLGAENSIRQKQMENIGQQREKMEAQLATMDETSAEYNSLRMQILQLDEQEMKLSADIEATTKRMKENEVQVKKYRTAVEGIVKSEIEARIQKRKQMRDAEISLENDVLKAFKKAYQDRWEIYKKDLEKQKENLEKQKELIDENLNARRNADDMAEKYAELAQLRYQLSMIETDASRTKDAKELRKKIEELEKDINWTRAENQAELEKSAIDTQIEGIENTIDEGDEDVQEYLANDNNFAAEVASVMSLQREDIVRWLEAHDETFANSLAVTQDKMAETWTDTTKQWYGIIDTYLEEITEILRSSESFMNYMKDSDTYLNGSDAAKFINEYDWSEAYRLMVDSQKDDAEIKWGQDYAGGTGSFEDIMDNLNSLLGRYNTQYRFTKDYFDSIVDAYSLDSIGGVDSLWDEIANHLNYLTAFENSASSTIDIKKESTAEQDISSIKDQLKTMEHYWKYSYVYGDTEFSSGYTYDKVSQAQNAAVDDIKAMYESAIKMITSNNKLSEAEKTQALTDAAATYAAAKKSLTFEEEWFPSGSNSRQIVDNSDLPYIKWFYLQDGEIKAEAMRATQSQVAKYNAGDYGYLYSYNGKDYLSQADYGSKQGAIDTATAELNKLYDERATLIERQYKEKETKINASSKSESKKKDLVAEARSEADKALNSARIERDQAINRIKTYNKKNITETLKPVVNGGGSSSGSSSSAASSNPDALDAFTSSIASALGSQYAASSVSSQALAAGSPTASLGDLQAVGRWSLLDAGSNSVKPLGVGIDEFAKSLYGTSVSSLASSDVGYLRDLAKQANYMPAITPMSVIDTSNFTNNGFNIQSMTVAIHEASFTDDQDYQELAKRVGDEFARELSKRGFNTANYSF